MTISFKVRVNNLVTDPSFLRLAGLSNEPNIFRIVGQSRYERWHSAFWGWLLDPQGSHRLGDFTLSRLFTILFGDEAVRPKNAGQLEGRALSRISLHNVTVRPNENDHTEVSVDAGRLDVFVTGDLGYPDERRSKFNLLIEFKVESKIRAQQSIDYADWLMNSHPEDVNFLLYLLPNRQLRSTPEGSVGDPRWFCVGFQSLHDDILLPIEEHHALSPHVEPFIEQYIKNLRIPYKGNKMAITQEERELARAIYDQYSDVFETISEALRDEGIEIELEEAAARKESRSSGRMAVKIDGREFEGFTVPELFGACLKYLVDTGVVSKMPLPWGRGTNRYVIARSPDPIHPSGREFFSPVEYQGYVMESHMERQRGFTVLSQLCEYLDLDFVVVES
ncbi:MAG: PD-(D/E)XK nuclease family protein [Chloroflexi bacterium]|nr:PD-(D/E)XK nuclease family protein [Chloroflexota bacterium]